MALDWDSGEGIQRRQGRMGQSELHPLRRTRQPLQLSLIIDEFVFVSVFGKQENGEENVGKRRKMGLGGREWRRENCI